MAYTANSAGFSSVIDTVENKLFDVAQSIKLPGTRYLTSISFSKNSDRDRKIYLSDYASGNLLISDGANFKFLEEVVIQNQNLPYYEFGAVDTAVDSEGNIYVAHTTSGLEEPPPFRPIPPPPWNPSPGGISVIDKNGNLQDIDNDPTTTSEGAPEGITRIDLREISIFKFYPYSISILNLQRDQKFYEPMDGYPGEYAIVSGVGDQLDIERFQCICISNDGIPPVIYLLSCADECEPNYKKVKYPIYRPRPLRIGIVDLNKWVVEDISRGILGINVNYRKFIGAINPGTDGQMLGLSDQGIDFYVLPDGSDATVYAVNPYEGKVYYFSFLEAVRNPQAFKYKSIQLNCYNDLGEQIDCTPTDVKVQNVLQNTYAYITNAGDDSVTVLDTATNMPIGLPIEQNICSNIFHYPTSFDTRSIGDRGYSSDFYSSTVSVFDLPNSSIYEPCQIDLPSDSYPKEIAVQHVNTLNDLFFYTRDLIRAGDMADFTQAPKKDNLVRKWENVNDLAKTSADSTAVLANIDNFQRDVKNWILNENLKNEIKKSSDLYKAVYLKEKNK